MAGLLSITSALQRDAHSILPAVWLRPHAETRRERVFVWQWFLDRWAEPQNVDRRLTHAVSVVALTPEILRKMTQFWTQFSQAPDSIQKIASWGAFEGGSIDRAGRYRKAVPVQIASTPVLVPDLLDLGAVAVRYPFVTTALASAGL